MVVNQQNQIAEPGLTSELSIFNLEKKVDSADKIAAVAGLPKNNFWWADEFNLQQDQLIQSAINAINLNLTWSNKSDEWKVASFYDKIHLLRAQIDSSEVFDAKEVKLCIKRYKPARTERTSTISGKPGFNPIYKSSGFKNFGPSEKRPREVVLNTNQQIVDFKFENFFKINGDQHDSLGIRRQGFKLSAYIYVQFHLEVLFVEGDTQKKYYSKPLKTIQVRSSIDRSTKDHKLSFKLT